MEMDSTRLVMVGGFLGAGKTTWIEAAAKRLLARGMKPAVITNDQATDLVDTGSIRRAGLPVAEVAGGCFCCRFEDLTGAALKLRRTAQPDVILAEPVGSCADLSATVMQPLKQYFRTTLAPAPFSVLLDPDRARDCIEGGTACALPDDARYILHKQAEEADLLLLNKVDRLDADGRDALQAALQRRYPDRRVLLVSGLTGAGLDAWLDEMLRDPSAGRRIVEVDYDRYAHGEAVLGWLNAAVEVTAESDGDWNEFARGLFGGLHQAFRAASAEVAHLKMSLTAGGGRFQANLTGTAREPGYRTDGAPVGKTAVLIVNARVAIEPERLRGVVEDALRAPPPGFRIRVSSMACFRPGRPQPVHRFRTVVA
jgi:G3E family GTPase